MELGQPPVGVPLQPHGVRAGAEEIHVRTRQRPAVGPALGRSRRGRPRSRPASRRRRPGWSPHRRPVRGEPAAVPARCRSPRPGRRRESSPRADRTGSATTYRTGESGWPLAGGGDRGRRDVEADDVEAEPGHELGVVVRARTRRPRPAAHARPAAAPRPTQRAADVPLPCPTAGPPRRGARLRRAGRTSPSGLPAANDSAASPSARCTQSSVTG